MSITNPYKTPTSTLGANPSNWERIPLFVRRFCITLLWSLPINVLWGAGPGSDSVSEFFERAVQYFDNVLWLSLSGSVLGSFIPTRRKAVFVPIGVLTPMLLLFLFLALAITYGGWPAG